LTVCICADQLQNKRTYFKDITLFIFNLHKNNNFYSMLYLSVGRDTNVNQSRSHASVELATSDQGHLIRPGSSVAGHAAGSLPAMCGFT
jgi:hypothetical protein